MRNPGAVLSRDQLLDGAWDMSFERRSNVIDVYVALSPQQTRPRRDRDGARDGVSPERGRVSSIPIRVRLTIAFAAAMVCVIGAMAVLVYVRVGGALMTSVDQTLRAQATEALAHAHDEHGLVDPDAASGVTLAQVVNATGSPIKSSQPGLLPLLDRRTAAASAHGETLFRSVSLQRPRGEWRVLAEPAPSGGAIVVARSLAERDEALHRIFRELLIAGPLGVLLASLAGLRAGRRCTPAGRGHASASRRRDAVVVRPPAGLTGPRRDLAARGHAQRHALAAPCGPRARAPFRRRREPRAADAGRTSAHRARAGSAPTAVGRGAHAAIRSALDETVRLSRLADDLLLARASRGGLACRCAGERIGTDRAVRGSRSPLREPGAGDGSACSRRTDR